MHIPRDLAIIGLTGGSGAGKGLVAARLSQHGIPTLDTDQVSRSVTDIGSPCLSALTAYFGQNILLSDGALNRGALATLVFSAPDVNGDESVKKERLSALNSITHKYILEACERWACAKHENGYRTVCMDAPQLFESGLDAACRYTLAVTAKKEMRIARIISRDGMDTEAAEARIAAQHDDAFFAEHCTAVIENNGTKEALFAKVDAFLKENGLI